MTGGVKRGGVWGWGGGVGRLHVSSKKGEYQIGGMKKERGADTPFCTMTLSISQFRNQDSSNLDHY